MSPGLLKIKEKSYLTDAPPSDMPTNTAKLYQPRLLHCQYKNMPSRELPCRCSCSVYACFHSITATNTAAVQTCLLVECCCNMDACWIVATQSACLPAFCHSIVPLILLVWCLTISRVCWCGVLL